MCVLLSKNFYSTYFGRKNLIYPICTFFFKVTLNCLNLLYFIMILQNIFYWCIHISYSIPCMYCWKVFMNLYYYTISIFHILTPSIISPYGGRVLLWIDWSEFQWHHQSRATDWVSRTFYRTKTIAMMVKENVVNIEEKVSKTIIISWNIKLTVRNFTT